MRCFVGQFTLSDEEDFWTIIAEREMRATELRSRLLGGSPQSAMLVSTEEAMEMEGVEAAVVI